MNLVITFSAFQSARGFGETILNISSDDTDVFPLVDFHPTDFGKPNQGFGFKMGPVCFS